MSVETEVKEGFAKLEAIMKDALGNGENQTETEDKAEELQKRLSEMEEKVSVLLKQFDPDGEESNFYKDVRAAMEQLDEVTSAIEKVMSVQEKLLEKSAQRQSEDPITKEGEEGEEKKKVTSWEPVFKRLNSGKEVTLV